MNLKHSLLSGFFWRWLFFLSLFLLNIAFSRYFGAAESGKVYFITNTLNLFLLISTLNVELGIGYYAARKSSGVYTLLITGVFFCFFSILILFALQSWPLTGSLFKDAAWPWYYPLIFVGGNCIANIICPLFYAKRNYILPNGLLSFFMLLLAVIYFVATSTRYSNTRLLMHLYFWLPLVQSLLLTIIFIIKEYTTLKENTFSLLIAKAVIKYSALAFTNSILFFLLIRVDYWLVEHFSTKADLGNYIQVSKFGQLLLIVPTVFSLLILPRVADGSIKKYSKTAALLFFFLIALFSIAFIALLLAGPMFFVKLMGPDYAGMYIPAIIKIPAILFLSMQNVLGIWFAGKNMIRYNLYSTVIGLVAVVIANLIFIPAMGIAGASIASLCAYAVAFFAAIYFYNAKSHQRFKEVLSACVSLVVNWKTEIRNLKK